MAKIYGQLERAQLENLGADPSGGIAGRVFYNTADSKPKVDNGAAIKELVVADLAQTLTNKTIDADSNTITNIENADIKAAAAIAVNKLAAVTASRALASDGSGFITPSATTATELGYVNGVTSAIQTQLDAKIAKSLVTTKGDLIVATANATPARLGVGSNGTFLKANSGVAEGVEWGSVSFNLSVQSKTTTFTASTADDVYLCSTSGGAYSATLPTAVGNSGKIFRFKKTTSDFTVLTIDGDGTETIDGATTTTLNTQHEELSIISDGTNWHILDRRTPYYNTATLSVLADTSGPTKGTIVLDSVQTERSGKFALIDVNYVQTTVGAAAGSGLYLFTLPHSLTLDATTNSFDATLANDSNDVGQYLGSGLLIRSGADQCTVHAYAYDSTRYVLKFGVMQDATGTTISSNTGNYWSSASAITFAHNIQLNLNLKCRITDWKS